MQNVLQEKNPQQPVTETGPVVLFDGVCNLCSWPVQFLASRERPATLRYATIQSGIGASILERHDLPVQDYESFVLLEDGEIHLKSRAFFRLVKYMRWPWPLLRVGLILPAELSARFLHMGALEHFVLDCHGS